MFEKTRVIVLHVTKHSDTTSVVHLYTERFGRINCLVSGVHSKKSSNRNALYAPLSVLEVELGKTTSDLQRIQESRLLLPLVSVPFDPYKQSVAFFLAEILYKVLRHPIENDQLFDFLLHSIQLLDATDQVANFHLIFLMQLSHYLGFYPNLAGDGTFFDMENGEKSYYRPLHANFLIQDECRWFAQICTADYQTMHQVKLSRVQRSQLLRSVVKYYTLHVPEFYGVKSIDVLETLFD